MQLLEWMFFLDDTLDMLLQIQYFSTVDLGAEYRQVQMCEDSQEKLLMSIPDIMNFKQCLLGFVICPQRFMETVLAGLTRSCCLVYLDDMMVI